jgi:transglutaminase-like putative cysteine protease
MRLRFMTPHLQWLTSRPITDVTRYQATSYPQFPPRPPRHGTATPALRDYTELPPWLQPAHAGAGPANCAATRAWPRPARDATPALVNAALQRLRTGGYRYTLEPGVYGQHTADEFWFDRKEGFCEHIASAFVVLMRAHGRARAHRHRLPGRRGNTVDGYWTVRQSDAHAWAEVWMAGRGWVRVDPTSAVAPGRIGV